MPPGQHIPQEGFGHQGQVDRHAEQPDQFAGRLVRTIEQTAKHMQVDNDKKRRRAGGMHIAQDIAKIDVAHDVLDRSKGALRRGLVTHSQPDASEQLVNQHQQGEHPKKVPEVEILGRVVLAHMGIPRALNGQARVEPAPKSYQPLHAAASVSIPITTTLSLS